MDIKQLRALVTVVEAGSVTKASQLLHLVQPAVSRQISGLESELGVKLFERGRHGMRPTAAGAAFADRARRALAELERGRSEVEPSENEVTGVATVGILHSVEDLLAEPLVRAVTAKHPGIELRLMTAFSGHLQQWLDDGELDVSLLYNLTSTQSVRVVPLLTDRLWAVAPPGADLQVDRPVDLATALQHPFVMPASGQHGLRMLIDHARVDCNVVPRVIVQANSMSLQTLLVKAGHGWTILPAPGVADDVAAGRLSAAPLTNPDIPRSIGIGFKRTGRTPAAVEAVAAELLRIIRSTVRRGRWPSAALINDGPSAQESLSPV